MQKAERIYNILKNFNGKQVGGKDSTRVEVDLGLLLQYMELEDRLQEIEAWLRDTQYEIGDLLREAGQ